MKKLHPRIISVVLLIFSLLTIGSIAVNNTISPGAISDDLEPGGPGG